MLLSTERVGLLLSTQRNQPAEFRMSASGKDDASARSAKCWETIQRGACVHKQEEAALSGGGPSTVRLTYVWNIAADHALKPVAAASTLTECGAMSPGRQLRMPFGSIQPNEYGAAASESSHLGMAVGRTSVA